MTATVQDYMESADLALAEGDTAKAQVYATLGAVAQQQENLVVIRQSAERIAGLDTEAS